MATLQRSATTFRRSGSSGLVWNERFFSAELAKPKNRGVGPPTGELSEPLRHNQGVGRAGGLTGGIARIRTRGPLTAAAAATEPPSPTVPVCLCCGFSTGKHDTDKRAKRRA